MYDSASLTAAKSSNKKIVFYVLAVTIFILPKFFGSYSTVNIPSAAGRWAFIILTDLLPFAVISAWAISSLEAKTPHTKPATKGDDPLLTLRFTACFMVVSGHYFGVVFADTQPHAVAHHPELALLMSSPWAGVWIFFVLSGYLMGKGFFMARYSLDNCGIARFICNRGIRILPLYIFSILLVAVLVTPYIFKPKYLWILAQTLSFDYNGRLPINVIGALWSVSTEFQFYLLSPFLAVFIIWVSRHVLLGYWTIGIVAGGGLILSRMIFKIASHAPGGVFATVYNCLGCNLYLFLSGMLLAKIIQQSDLRKSALNLKMGLLCLAGLVVGLALGASILLHIDQSPTQYILYAPVITLVGTVLIIRLFETAELTGVSAKIIKWTQTGGALTYSFYVFHSPIMLSLRQIAPVQFGFLDQFMYLPLVVVLIIAVSYFFYRAIEKPFAAFKL